MKKKRGRPVGSKNKGDALEQITIGQLSIRIMECMAELRRQNDGVAGAYQSISQMTEAVNHANSKIVKQMQVLESKLAELEKLVLGKMPSLEDTEVEQ